MSDNGSSPRAIEAALADAQRAMDHAIRTMFELAYRLESLREAIERANIDTRWQLSEYGWAYAPSVADDKVDANR